ncbi:DUF1624 domain-containing protein [Rhodobacteraceae bacterium D3-12]|nr:DUF1624 domain-containing protein [Rhodobacteraceae bacterium D3-12]
MTVEADGASAALRGRIDAVDLARTIAIVGMVVFHFTRDLEDFGLIAAGTTLAGGWAVFAMCVAGGFIFLAGVSLVLAHGAGVRWAGYFRRLGLLVAAAGAVSVATWVAMPHAFIFFGILHSIALSSVLGLAFLRRPLWLTGLVGVGVVALPMVYRSEVFTGRWGAWTGLSPWVPPTLDFEPVFPWFAPFLFGMMFAHLAARFGVWTWLRVTFGGGRVPKALLWPGRHSLMIYLVHQPILIGLLWCAIKLGLV